MAVSTHSQCIYISITLASPHYDVMRLKPDKEQNHAYIILAFKQTLLEQFKQIHLLIVPYYPHGEKKYNTLNTKVMK